MRVKPGDLILIGVAVVLAAVFVRLGLWQLERGEERELRNERIEARLALPRLELPGDRTLEGRHLPPAESLGWRRVRLRGVYDFEREVVLRARSHLGRPGVEVLTPLRLADGRDAVLVSRGWLRSPDALHAPLLAGRPADGDDTVMVEGVVRPAPSSGAGDAAPMRVAMDGEEPLVLARPSAEAVASTLPYPLAPFHVQATDPGPAGPALERLPEPAPEAGPHLGYAIQWFAFAAVALGGTAALLWTRRTRGRRRSRGGARPSRDRFSESGRS